VNGPKVYMPNWLMIVDEQTELKYSIFHEKKDGMVEQTCKKFRKWQNDGIPLTSTRCDNRGENKTLKARCQTKYKTLTLGFEYTTRDTHQQNSPGETS
jgi:hypothetical protein